MLVGLSTSHAVPNGVGPKTPIVIALVAAARRWPQASGCQEIPDAVQRHRAKCESQDEPMGVVALVLAQTIPEMLPRGLRWG